MKAYLKLIRTEQYIKNLFVFAPLFFGRGLHDTALVAATFAAFVCFCAASGGIYILNDFFDIVEDREHPEKSKRPLASGAVGIKNAFALMFVLLTAALGVSFLIAFDLFLVIAVYIALNILYSKWLKHIAILDINIIAVGFVLRLLAGTAVTQIVPSVWILLITYLLALFLAIAKRRSDVVLAQSGKDVRKNIEGYNLIFIDITMGILSSVIIVCYIFYCISPEIQRQYHSELLYLSIIFVINGIFRYLKLAFVNQSTYSPTLVVLKDRFLQITILCWLLLLCFLLYFN